MLGERKSENKTLSWGDSNLFVDLDGGGGGLVYSKDQDKEAS